jgi:putative copper resistance protein D
LHTWVKKAVRSRVVSAITFPPFGAVLYLATIVGTHLTSFENVVLTDPAVRNAELALYLIAGYLYFLPLIGREPVRWRVSYPSRIFLLFIAMPVDAFTGLILGSDSSNPFPALATLRPSWAPSAINDVHTGGAVMWVGGAGIMFALVLAVFFAWSRETRSDGGLGWLESARRANFATLVSSHRDTGASSSASQQAGPASGTESVDDDDDQLAAYNAFLARINKSREP